MHTRKTLSIAAIMLLAACSQVGDGLRFAVNNINDFRTDATKAWHDFEHYRAPAEFAPQPQLRYCYQFQSDIVCYDAPQTDITAPLVGVQEGVPGRQIAGAQLVQDQFVYAETAPQHDVFTNEIGQLEVGELGAEEDETDQPFLTRANLDDDRPSKR